MEYYLESERKEEADFFEENFSNKALTEFYDLVASPPSKASKTSKFDKEISMCSASKTIMSTSDPIKSLTLNILVRESPKGDS